MPFEAAKAVAATFCYNIRYALTPIFGIDFLGHCVVPEDPRFGRMVIDRNIVRHCTEAANELAFLSRGLSPR
jgi:ABC-type dipeptide/oligopeptide/nickel transport system permease subunit